MSHSMMEETDEAFLQTLYRGSELIGQGSLDEARESLEAAVSMRPDDPKARNLLGLACFKLGDYPAAEYLYDSLVKDNPADSTLRVNLGLVHLKAGRFEEAIRELGSAVELQPDHRRAQNYLGLAYARVGDYAQAQECFIAAGSDQMVERMERLMSGEGEEDPDVAAAAPGPQPPGAGRLDTAGSNGEVRDAHVEAQSREVAQMQSADQPQNAEAPAAVETPAYDYSGQSQDQWQGQDADAGQSAEQDWSDGQAEAGQDDFGAGGQYPAGAQAEYYGDASQAPASDYGHDVPVEQYPAEYEQEAPAQGAEVEQPVEQSAGYAPTFEDDWGEGQGYPNDSSEPPPPTIDSSVAGTPKSSLSSWVLPARLLELADELALPSRIPAPFAVSRRVVVAVVEREMLCRASGLLAMEGHLDLRPEVKRFRGRATEKPFGEGERRILRLTGNGRIYIATRGRRFTPVRIDGADAYLWEETVFAFQETVAYENGRVPSKVSADLNLVHLRGQGVVLIETAGPLVATLVTPGVPLRVPLERLVGWTGLVTPRIVAFADEGGADGEALTGLELAGEGRVLISLPAEN